jgi:hypothetical protein
MMSEHGDRIIKALDEVLAWSRGKGRLPVWLPDGTRVELSVEEYEMLRLGEHDPRPTPTDTGGR